MADTYEITDNTTNSKVVLKNDGTPQRYWSFPKANTSIFVNEEKLNLYLGTKLIIPKIPKALITVPSGASSMTDEQLFNALSFMSGGGGGASASIADRSLPAWQRFYCGVKNAVQIDSIAPNNLYAYPIVIDKACNISQISGTTIGSSAGNSALVGLYSSLNGYPDQLLGQATYSLTTAGFQVGTFSSSFDVQPGTYWYAFLAQASVTWRTIQPDWEPTALLGFPFGNSASFGYTRIGLSYPYQPNLPATFPLGAIKLITNNPVFELYCQ